MHFTLAVLQTSQQKTHPTTVDGRNPKQPPGMYKTRRKKLVIFSISTGAQVFWTINNHWCLKSYLIGSLSCTNQDSCHQLLIFFEYPHMYLQVMKHKISRRKLPHFPNSTARYLHKAPPATAIFWNKMLRFCLSNVPYVRLFSSKIQISSFEWREKTAISCGSLSIHHQFYFGLIRSIKLKSSKHQTNDDNRWAIWLQLKIW